MRTLILLLAVLLVVYILRYLWSKQGLTSRQISQKLFLYGLAAAVLLLIISGRLPWLVGAIGAVLLALGRLLPLVRYVPILRNLYQRHQGTPSAAASGGGQSSTVQSRYLRMILDHNTGTMDGEVLLGRWQGSKLSELQMEQLVGLLGEFADDTDSMALLQTYLDREHGDWREQTGYSQNAGQQRANNRNTSGAGANGQMTAQEAYDILGLAPGASKEQVVAAHRRLMQKLHPDRGGSGYLAAKINSAKDFLLKTST